MKTDLLVENKNAKQIPIKICGKFNDNNNTRHLWENSIEFHYSQFTFLRRNKEEL